MTTDHQFSREGDGAGVLGSATLAEARSFVSRRAEELVTQLIRQRERQEPPFLAKHFASLVRVKDVVRADLGDQDGMLLRRADGYVVKVNANHPAVRQNFSCAHEIGHIILDEFVQSTPSTGTDFRGASGAVEKARERLCDRAAAELLMPRLIFRKYLLGFGLSIDSVGLLARVFGVSVPAAAIRVTEVSPNPCVAILWKPWHKRHTTSLRAAWAVGPEGAARGNEFIPRNTCVPRNSKLFKALETDSTVKTFKVLRVHNENKRCPIESKRFGAREMPYVMSLAFFNM